MTHKRHGQDLPISAFQPLEYILFHELKGVGMQRRDFMAVLGVAPFWTVAVHAQRTNPKRIGVLWHAASADEERVVLNPLVEGIAKHGYVSGQNVIFEHRFPAERPERFKALARELVQLGVDIIITSGPSAAFAAKEATKTIPIIFTVVPDPVETGLVDSLASPGGNVTGLALVDISPKRLEVFKEAFPGLSQVALMVNQNDRAGAQRFTDTMGTAADNLKLPVRVIEVAGPQEFERAFSEVRAKSETGILLPFDSMFFASRNQLAQTAIAHGLPIMGYNDIYVKAGSFISYGPDSVELFRRAGAYVDKIFSGSKPADLPVQQPTTYNLAINLKTARAIGLAVPPSLLTRADVVVE